MTEFHQVVALDGSLKKVESEDYPFGVVILGSDDWRVIPDDKIVVAGPTHAPYVFDPRTGKLEPLAQ